MFWPQENVRTCYRKNDYPDYETLVLYNFQVTPLIRHENLGEFSLFSNGNTSLERKSMTNTSSEKYCSGCGNGLIASAAICPNCGTPAGQSATSAGSVPTGQPQRDFMVALLLSIFVGSLGVDRFYTGQIGLGIGKLLITLFTCGFGGWVWWLIDIILIATGSYRDAQGRPLVKS